MICLRHSWCRAQLLRRHPLLWWAILVIIWVGTLVAVCGLLTFLHMHPEDLW